MSYSDKKNCFKHMQKLRLPDRYCINYFKFIFSLTECDDLGKTTCKILHFNRYFTVYSRWVRLSLMYIRNKPNHACRWSAGFFFIIFHPTNACLGSGS